MQDNVMKLHDRRNLGFAEYGRREGIPLFLFHGIPGSRIFKGFEDAPWIEHFGLRVITPDRPGCGLSDPAPGRKICDWASDVAELADHLGIDRFHVAGGSGGGPYALACAIRLPERVLSATPFCSGCPPEVTHLSKDMQFGNRLVFVLAKYAPFLLKALLATTAKNARKYPEKYMAKVRSQTQGSKKHVTANRSEHTLMHLQEAFRQGAEGAYCDMLLVSHPWHLDLDKIAVPVFMWHGAEDKLMPISSAREFSKLIPGCEPHFIPGAGHDLLGSEEIRSQMIVRMLAVST